MPSCLACAAQQPVEGILVKVGEKCDGGGVLTGYIQFDVAVLQKPSAEVLGIEAELNPPQR